MEQDSIFYVGLGFVVGFFTCMLLLAALHNENAAVLRCVEKGYDADICQDFLN